MSTQTFAFTDHEIDCLDILIQQELDRVNTTPMRYGSALERLSYTQALDRTLTKLRIIYCPHPNLKCVGVCDCLCDACIAAHQAAEVD